MYRSLFYLQYAAHSLWRSRRWSTFGIFSIAAGVATVVALRSLGLAIGDALTSNVRSSNHGDVTLMRGNDGFLSFGNPDEADVFTEHGLRQIQEWVEARGGHLSAYIRSGSIQLTALDFNAVGRPQFITTLFVDPLTYPPTDDIWALDPPGVPLGDLFQGGNEVVVSQNLAQSQGIEVGDVVRVSGTEEQFVVRGIVPTTAEAGLRNLFAAFFGFAYIDIALADNLPVPSGPNMVSVALPDGTSPEDIQSAAQQLDTLAERSGGWVRTRSVPDLLEDNQRIADVLGSFIVVLGLGALLIGGVGIINTMLVMVRRRMEEIAALKTFGLKGRQVAALFLAEAIWLGLVGSLLGSVFGVLLSGAANAYGATLIQQPLAWHLYPEAVLFGLALGMVITVVFGVLPVLTAVRVRPAIILRPNETHIPRVGVLHSLAALLLVIVVVGVIAGQIVAPTFQAVPDRITDRFSLPAPYIVGIVGVAVTLLILGVLIGLLWVVVWMVGKLPSFRSVDLWLALRNLTTRRVRTATTLLALSAGMFALSSIAFFGAGAREILQYTVSEAFGGNVMIFPVLPPTLAQPLIDAKLNQLGDAVSYRTRLLNYSGEIESLDGQSVEDMLGRNVASGPGEADSSGDAAGRGSRIRQARGFARDTILNWVVRDTDNPNLEEPDLLAGRNLTLADRGKPVAVVKLNSALAAAGMQVGSRLAVRLFNCSRNCTVELEVVGMLPEDSFENFQASVTLGDMLVPPRVMPDGMTTFQLNVIQVEPERLNEVLLELSSLPLVFAIDITFIDGLLSRMIDQMSAIPILVGLLSLGAAAVIMANTVALSTLERRRQIGILKAVGLKGARVMRVMLLENTLVSLLGGLIGLGLSALGVVLMTNFGLEIAILVPDDALPVAVALLAAAVLIGWLATVLSARVVVRERVLNVLRYE